MPEDPENREALDEDTGGGTDEKTGEMSAATDAGSGLVDLPIVTSDAELSFDEALGLTGRRGARLLLPMGETGTGKTTITAEIWTRLVGTDPIQGYRCAGSRTSMALEERAFLSRVSAGMGVAETPRTQIGENEGLLHLRMARPDGVRVELLVADYAGERFRRIREGVPLVEEFPWVARADRIAILVDGADLGAHGTQELALNYPRRLIFAIREAGTLNEGARLSVVLTKDDEVGEETWGATQAGVNGLLEEARSLDSEATLIRVAARPGDGSDPWGLRELLDWICSDDRAGEATQVESARPSRAIARLRDDQ